MTSQGIPMRSVLTTLLASLTLLQCISLNHFQAVIGVMQLRELHLLLKQGHFFMQPAICITMQAFRYMHPGFLIPNCWVIQADHRLTAGLQPKTVEAGRIIIRPCIADRTVTTTGATILL